MADNPKFGAEIAAMIREGIKDVRETVMETFVNSPEHSTEPGVPLSPTVYEVTKDRGLAGGNFEDRLAQYEPPQQEAGREMGGMER